MSAIVWVFVYLANYLVSFFIPDWSLDPPQDFATILWGEAPSLFELQGAFCACVERKVFLDLRSGHLISLFWQSSAFTTSFVIGVFG